MEIPLGETPGNSELHQLVLEHASDAILVVTVADLVVRVANRRLEELTGIVVRDLVGASAEVLFPEASGDPTHRNFGPDILDTRGVQEDVRIRKADDYCVFTQVAVAHLETETGTVAVCIVRDTSARRMLERELITKHVALQRSNAELAEKTAHLEARNEELVAMSGQVAALSKRAAIGEFTASTAHGLNNPLAAVISTARLMNRALGAEDTARAKQLLGRLTEAAQRIQQVIQDMRQVHREGSTRPAAERVDICSEIRAAVHLLEHKIEPPRFLACELEDVGEIMAHPDELHHLILNLIDNALNAVVEGGNVTVKLRTEDERLKFIVEDDGPGVPAELMERVFDPFVTTREEGTGLGLCVAQRIAQHHRGRLYVENNEPKGARFVFECSVHGVGERVHANAS